MIRVVQLPSVKRFAIHPFLFSLYSVIFLIATNARRIPISASFRVLLYQFTLVTLLFLLLSLLTRSWQRAGLVTSLAVLLFNSFGHLSAFLASQPSLSSTLGRADVLAAIYAATFILLGWWFIRKAANPGRLGEYLNLVAVLLLILPVIQISGFYLRQAAFTLRSHSELDPGQQPVTTGRAPDIYYLVLDEYGRADVLQEVLFFDNSDFIQYLEQNGFFVASQSHANYAITQFSIQSSLNFDYIDPQNQANRYAALELIAHNRARNFLVDQGYQFISFASGYSQTDISDADIYFKPQGYINSFEFMYFLSSALVFGIDDFYFPQSRLLISMPLEKLKEIPDLDPDVPKFVFAHIPAAHVPYVFGPDGELDQPWTLPSVPTDPNEARQGYMHGYRGQVVYVNQLLKEAIDIIIKNSPVPPVIILQGDHGPQSLYKFSLDEVCVKERMSILNAYYLPGVQNAGLYPTITPVNTFRLIFDQYFNTDFGLLDDRSYLTARDDLSQIVDVTSQVDRCQLP